MNKKLPAGKSFGQQEQKATSRNIEPTAGTVYYQQEELFCQQEHTCPQQLAAATYSASVEEVATMVYFLHCHEINLLPRN
ncbi:hypothetical protein Tco_1516993 [Tanacetum coccineum]